MPIVSRVRRHLSFVHVSNSPNSERDTCARSLVERLAASRVHPEALDVDPNGYRLIINDRDESAFVAALAGGRDVITLRGHCARVALTRAATDWPLPSLERLLPAIAAEGIDIVHLSGDAASMTIVVDEHDADRVVSLLTCSYRRPSAVA
jgi:aspartokinase